jgi:hypothetical protein
MIYLDLKYQFQQILNFKRRSISLYRNGLIYEMNLLFRFVTSFVIQLSCVDLHMHKKSQKREFRFLLFWLFHLLWNPLMKLNISYVIEKRGFLHFLPPAEKASIFGPFLKILQLVHARNRPIQQPFVQFLVESNSHQYGLREWPPCLGCPYKGHDEHKYPL